MRFDVWVFGPFAVRPCALISVSKNIAPSPRASNQSRNTGPGDDRPPAALACPPPSAARNVRILRRADVWVDDFFVNTRVVGSCQDTPPMTTSPFVRQTARADDRLLRDRPCV